MKPKTTKKNQKKPLRKGLEAVSKVKADDAAQAKSLYIQGHSLAQVCQTFFQYSRAQWRRIKNKDCWDKERRAYCEALKKTTTERLNQSKEQFGESISSLAEQLYQKVHAGEIRLETVGDAERLLKMIYLHINDGAEKQEVKVTAGLDWKAFAHKLLAQEQQDPTLFEKLGAL